jgi:hypothetical protein
MLFIILTCAFTCLAAEQALSAIKFKRFPHCPEGIVTKKPVNATPVHQAAFTFAMWDTTAIRM